MIIITHVTEPADKQQLVFDYVTVKELQVINEIIFKLNTRCRIHRQYVDIKTPTLLKKCYQDYDELFQSPEVNKALLFAHKNPRRVYGKATVEYDSVRHGFFGLYFNEIESNSAEDRQ